MDQVSAHLDRAWELVGRGDFRAALQSAEKGLELDAGSADAHYLVGYIHAQEGSAEEALEHYEQALELDDTFFEAMLNAAEVLVHSLGDSGEALRLLDDALDYAETPEEIADALLLRIDAHLLAGDTESARRSLALVPDGPFENPHIEFLIARARFEVGNLEGVEAMLRRVIAAEPHHSDAYYYLGLALDRAEDLRGATVAFLHVRELDAHAPRPPWAVTTELFEKRIEHVVGQVSAPFRSALDGTLVVVVESPGAEVVADGVDPRATLLLDALGPADEPPKVGRLFIYQRNVERAVPSVHAMDEEILLSIERELRAAFPTAYPAAVVDGGAESN